MHGACSQHYSAKLRGHNRNLRRMLMPALVDGFILRTQAILNDDNVPI